MKRRKGKHKWRKIRTFRTGKESGRGGREGIEQRVKSKNSISFETIRTISNYTSGTKYLGIVFKPRI